MQVESLEARCLLAASVVSYHGDAASTGVNPQETVLTPSNVNSVSFGKVFSTPVDGFVYAQPLFLSGLNLPGQGVHDVVFAATEHDSVYALDGATGSVLWHISFLTSGLPGATSITTVPSKDVKSPDIVPEIGITGTPVIDSSTQTLYVAAETKEIVGGTAHYVQRLHAIDCLTGAEKFGGPALIGNTTFVSGRYTNQTPIFVNGTGVGNDGHGHVFFNALRENQRPALTLVGGRLYISWASHSDTAPTTAGSPVSTQARSPSKPFSTTRPTAGWGASGNRAARWRRIPRATFTSRPAMGHSTAATRGVSLGGSTRQDFPLEETMAIHSSSCPSTPFTRARVIRTSTAGASRSSIISLRSTRRNCRLATSTSVQEGPSCFLTLREARPIPISSSAPASRGSFIFSTGTIWANSASIRPAS